MTQIVQQLIKLLEQLPPSIQERYGARWLDELIGDQGDGSVHPATPDENHEISFGDIRHLLGVFEGGPSDLSHNPKYMDGFGEA